MILCRENDRVVGKTIEALVPEEVVRDGRLAAAVVARDPGRGILVRWRHAKGSVSQRCERHGGAVTYCCRAI